MLHRTITPEGSTTLLSVLRVHLLTQLYSVMTLHSWMKWPDLPQKLHTDPGTPISRGPIFLGLPLSCCIWRTILNILPRLAMTALSTSILTVVGSVLVGMAVGMAGIGNCWYAVGCHACISCVSKVALCVRPPTTKLAASYMSSTLYRSLGMCIGNWSCKCCMMLCVSSGRKPWMKFHDCSNVDIQFLLMRYCISRNCQKYLPMLFVENTPMLRLSGPSAKARLGRGSLDHLMEVKP